MDSKIKILIACHRPSEVPKDDLFLPIEVGAATRIEHTSYQRDDEGDNISAKNPQYSEMSAVYWAWKNLDADYYGLFHYRRYYTFSNERFIPNEGHNFIDVAALSPEIFSKYGLSNETNMRKIIEENDIIVHEPRRVSKLPTPRGKKGKTLYEHYRLHDGTILKLSDVDLMLDVVKRQFPDVASDFLEYMNGHTYLGYNMFIMRKKFFKKMCEFTFGTLDEIEANLNDSLENRSVQQNRLYGYLAELLTSGFIYHLRKSSPRIKVAERQVIYAKNSEPLQDIAPLQDSIPIVFDLTFQSHLARYLFPAVLAQFSTTVNSNQAFHVIIAHRENLDPIDRLNIMNLVVGKKIQINFYDVSQLKSIEGELTGVKNPAFKLFMPWYLRQLNKVIVLNWHTWVKGNLSELFQIELGDYFIAGSLDFLDYGKNLEISKKQKVTKFSQLWKDLGIDTNCFINDNVLVMDLKRIREQKELVVARDLQRRMEGHTQSELVNAFYVKKSQIFATKWNTRISPDDSYYYYGTLFSPWKLYQQWQVALKHYQIGSFDPRHIKNFMSTEFTQEYLGVYAQLPIWPDFVLAMLSEKIGKPIQDEDYTPVGILAPIKKYLLNHTNEHSRTRQTLVAIGERFGLITHETF